jgi:hypothetical protein
MIEYSNDKGGENKDDDSYGSDGGGKLKSA